MDFDYDKSKFGKEKDGEFHVEVDYLKLIRNESFVDKGCGIVECRIRI